MTTAQMTRLVVAGVLMGTLAAFAQAPAEPYPGQRDHKEPPANYFCEHVGDQAHRCDCPGMTKDPMCKTPDGKAEPAEDVEPAESAKCNSYCWKDHCHCHQACDT